MNMLSLLLLSLLTFSPAGHHGVYPDGTFLHGEVRYGHSLLSPVRLKAGDLPAWDVTAPDVYNAKQLYGYINGGAEVYLEYGFRKVSAQRCSRDQHEFQVDIYEMVRPEAAFGMFSVLRGRCSASLPGTRWHCVTPEQILFVKGNFLVSIVPYDRAQVTRNTAMQAAKILSGRISGTDFRIPSHFRNTPMADTHQKLRFIQGPLALQNVLGDWVSRLDGISRYDMYHTVVGTGTQETEAAVITFRSGRDMNSFLKRIGATLAPDDKTWRKAGKGITVKEKGRQTVYVLIGARAGALADTWK